MENGLSPASWHEDGPTVENGGLSATTPTIDDIAESMVDSFWEWFANEIDAADLTSIDDPDIGYDEIEPLLIVAFKRAVFG